MDTQDTHIQFYLKQKMKNSWLSHFECSKGILIVTEMSNFKKSFGNIAHELSCDNQLWLRHFKLGSI